MADKIVELANNSKLCQQFGARAKEKVEQRYSREVIAPKILQKIETYLA